MAKTPHVICEYPKAVCKNKFVEYCYTFVDEFLYKKPNQ